MFLITKIESRYDSITKNNTFVSMEEKGLSLSELAQKIEQGIQQTLQPHYWIIAEISEMQANRNGHCYLELIEKPEDEDIPTAKMRATIWANKWRMIAPYFESETGCQLCVGMKIMVQVSVVFHALYGFSLQITDINPIYTIGEDERRRIQIIQQLEQDGIMDLNKEIPLPSVIQRIAVISSETAAGYQDFQQQLLNNQYSIQFRTELFPAAMQGIEVEKTIIFQLDAIAEREDEFDAVVIIRGGGARTDLRWFDNYAIASNIAQFPLPIIIGIGHDKDQSIADLVANTSLKTPTAVAEFIIDTCGEFVDYLNTVTNNFKDTLESILNEQKERIKDISHTLFQAIRIIDIEEGNRISQIEQKLKNSIEKRLLNEQSKLNLIDVSIKSKDPKVILSQGYTISTDSKGNILHSAKQVTKDETIMTHFADGTITSTVN